MTDEERQGLIAVLRSSDGCHSAYPNRCLEAADVIERLESDLNFEKESHKIQQRGIEYLIHALTEARELLGKNFERSERIERTLALFNRN